MKRRKSERESSDPIPERSSRVQFRDGGWYISTREHPLVGPYASEFDAQLNASKLMSQLAQAAPDTKPQTTIQSCLSDPSTRPVDLEAKREERKAPAARDVAPTATGRVLNWLLRRG